MLCNCLGGLGYAVRYWTQPRTFKELEKIDRSCRYTCMVLRLVTILLALSFVIIPLRMFALESCDWSVTNNIESSVRGENDAASSCCGVEDGQNDLNGLPRDQKNEPNDGCGCHLSCCSLSKTLAAEFVGMKSIPPRLGSACIGPYPQGACGSPHISRLMRPPRPSTIAT